MQVSKWGSKGCGEASKFKKGVGGHSEGLNRQGFQGSSRGHGEGASNGKRFIHQGLQNNCIRIFATDL